MCSKRHILAAVIPALAACAWGAPSRMRPVEVTGPDGKVVEVVAVGDEHSHRYLFADGGEVEWLPAVESVKLSPAMKLRASSGDDTPLRVTSFPTKGELPFLVVIVEFADKGFSFKDAAEEFDALLNEQGYSRYNGRGSVADYYRDNSAGAFSPRFEVAGPVKLSQGYSHYGSGSDDSRAGLMVVEACRMLDGEIDFKRYDLDGDGRVDNIYFYYAGKGEADGGDPGTIWPHAWNLSDQGRELTLDGVSIDAYACSPELDGEGKPNGIGTFCHEFAHVLGLPDLYASAYSSALHPATWSLMASGNYNDDGRTPPGLSSYERYELGWIEPKRLSYPLTVTLEPLGHSNSACRISTERDNEYFLLENRQQSGWDSSLPGHGMLVWHIDYNPNIWDRNVVNSNAAHQYVDIVEANNATSHSQDAGFTFPGSSRVTSLTSTTRPALVSWDGVPVDVPVTEISESADGVVTFKVCGGKTPVGTVGGLAVSDLEMESCLLSWDEAVMADTYQVCLTEDDGRETGKWETTGRSQVLTGLWPGKRYMATVCGSDRYEKGPESSVEIVMPDPTFGYMAVEAMEATDVTTEGFTANWQPLPGALTYRLTVGSIDVVDKGEALCGFDGKSLPAGWEASSTAWSSVDGYYGESAPALRMSADGASLTTPFFDSEIVDVSLFMRASSLKEGSRLIVSAIGNDGTVETVSEVELSAEGKRVNIDDVPPGVSCLRFSLAKVGNTAVTIDDVAVSLGEREEHPIPSWDSADVGDVTSVSVGGLDKERVYYYRVSAFDGDLSSLSSRRVILTTTATGAGVSSPVADSGVASDSGQIKAIYSIDGRRMMADDAETLPPGVYLLVTSESVSKIVVR